METETNQFHIDFAEWIPQILPMIESHSNQLKADGAKMSSRHAAPNLQTPITISVIIPSVLGTAL